MDRSPPPSTPPFDFDSPVDVPVDSPVNPFLVLRSRYWVLGTFWAASVAVGTLYAVLEILRWLPNRREDSIAVPIMTIAVWTVLVSVVLWVCRQRGLQLRPLFGYWPIRPLGWKFAQRRFFGRRWAAPETAALLPRFSLLYAGLLVLSLLIFSLGSFSVIFYLLSVVFPQYAANMLETNLMPGSGNSRYAELYDALMLFLLLVYAPLVEELVFRGILLQRWATKWGLPWGLVASSVLFGLLHFNNPLGLTFFGLVMGLLYVRSRSLWLPIVCHSLNNLAAVGIDWLSQMAGGAQSYTIADVQASWWRGLILMAMAIPLLFQFVYKSWPQEDDEIPYLVNCKGKRAV